MISDNYQGVSQVFTGKINGFVHVKCLPAPWTNKTEDKIIGRQSYNTWTRSGFLFANVETKENSNINVAYSPATTASVSSDDDGGGCVADGGGGDDDGNDDCDGGGDLLLFFFLFEFKGPSRLFHSFWVVNR